MSDHTNTGPVNGGERDHGEEVSVGLCQNYQNQVWIRGCWKDSCQRGTQTFCSTRTHTLTRTIPIWYDLGKPIYINICASARPRERSSRYPRSVRPISRLVGWRSQSLTEESIGIAIGSTDVTTTERVSQALCNTQFGRSHSVLLARNNGWDVWKDLHCYVTYESGFRWNANLGHSAKWFAIYVGIENWRRNKEWPCSSSQPCWTNTRLAFRISVLTYHTNQKRNRQCPSEITNRPSSVPGDRYPILSEPYSSFTLGLGQPPT